MRESSRTNGANEIGRARHLEWKVAGAVPMPYDGAPSFLMRLPEPINF